MQGIFDNGSFHFEYFLEAKDNLGQLTQKSTEVMDPPFAQDSTTDYVSVDHSIDSEDQQEDGKTKATVFRDPPQKTNDGSIVTPCPNRKLFTNTKNGKLTLNQSDKGRLGKLQNPVTSENTDASKYTLPYQDKIHPNSQFKKIYSSPYLEKEFKPSTEILNLTPELELLRLLIMSQHEAFTHSIIELGNTNLLLSDIIEKKKESLTQIEYNNKIPRSLRIKCGLTTSPSYANNTEFIKLKDELQEAVSSFIQKGTNIMVEWAEINIQLLKWDRCLSIISKALTLLDGLSSFFLEVVGTPLFPSLPATKHINLFLWKLYLSNQYIKVDDLAEFFDLPLEHIILLGAKILLKTDSEEEAMSALNNLNLSDIDVDNNIHEAFLSETLISFDQIIKITTIDTWTLHKERNKHTTAAQNLKAKMNSLQIITATEATAHAIAKATENVSITNSKDLTTNLRLSTLEKQVRKQDQKFNEKLSTLQQQKNSNGSYPTGSVASPDHLQTRTFQKIQINQKNQKKTKKSKKLQTIKTLSTYRTKKWKRGT